MLLLQGCFLLEVCVTKQCPPLMSDNAGIISSVSPPPFILSKSLIQAAKGVIFHFQERELLSKRLWTGVCPCVLSLRSHQARVTVIRSARYWCVHVCVACIPSQWGPVNMWGGTASSSVQKKRTACHLCCKSKDGYEYIMSWLPVKGWDGGGLRESRHCGLIKPNSCWFVLVEQIDGGKRGALLWKGSKDFLISGRNWGRDL